MKVVPMEQSLNASAIGLQQVDEARKQRGWNRQSVRWSQLALTSVSCLKQFWRGERIQRETFIRICEAVGCDWQAIAAQTASLPSPGELAVFDAASHRPQGNLKGTEAAIALGASFASKGGLPLRVDWGEAPEISGFLGRDGELARLRQVLGVAADGMAPSDPVQRHKVFGILGLGGIGKTWLVAQVVEGLASQSGTSGTSPLPFVGVVWRSLGARSSTCPGASPAQPPSLEQWLVSLAPSLGLGADCSAAEVRQTLRHQPWLLILDDWQAVLAEETLGYCRPEYAEYGDWLARMAQERHATTLVVISREPPRELLRYRSDRVGYLHLGGLERLATAQLIERWATLDLARPCAEPSAESSAGSILPLGADLIDAIATYYNHHPWALKLVATGLGELRGRQGTQALQTWEPLCFPFSDLQELLQSHLCRIAPGEQRILHTLAIAPTPQRFPDLLRQLHPDVPQPQLSEFLINLQQRSLLHISPAGYTLTPMLRDYIRLYWPTLLV